MADLKQTFNALSLLIQGVCFLLFFGACLKSLAMLITKIPEATHSPQLLYSVVDTKSIFVFLCPQN